jgi:hypothetical protein
MTISKDQSIITQVAAKIAADLTPKTEDVNKNVADFLVAFEVTTEALLKAHGMTAIGSEQEFTEAVAQVFGETAPVTNAHQMPVAQPQAQTSGGFTVRIKGKQHGPIPEWLPAACMAKGVTEVWDNRDRLADNPKRPWFKSTTSEDAFWQPRKR